MQSLSIEPKVEGKGRSFTATPLAFIVADTLWSGGQTATEAIRPIWIQLAGSDAELRPFVANLQVGRKAIFKKANHWSRRGVEKLEILKSAGYHTTWQRMPEGSVATIYLQDLFVLDPGMVDPAGIQFCLLPSREWIENQRVDSATAVDYLLTLADVDREELVKHVPIATLFAAYLDRRTRCPLVNDPRFYLQLYHACLTTGLASFSHSQGSHQSEVWGVHSRFHKFQANIDNVSVSVCPPIAFSANHEAFEELLVEQVQIYFRSI